MSKWPGKTVIGLTGNIGTGKSVVRRMLEHLGAYGIDADQLSHRAIAKGGPAYQQVLDVFGKFILAVDGEIDRSRLARVVFNNPEALATLEAIVHPMVEQAVDHLVRRATQPVIVIEAIKLLESSLHKSCDSIWAVYASPEVQIARLVLNRGITEEDARQRIAAQSSQEAKIAAAQVVIKNSQSYEDTWNQVVAAWKKSIKAEERATGPLATGEKAQKGEISIQRGGPRHCQEIADLINRFRAGNTNLTSDDIMAAFGEKAFLILKSGDTAIGVIGWQVENLVSRTTDIVLDPSIPVEKTLPVMIREMEKASRDLQSEAALLFLHPDLAQHEKLLHELGYDPREAESLGVLAWQEAAQESMSTGVQLFFKQLRVDRVLHPI